MIFPLLNGEMALGLGLVSDILWAAVTAPDWRYSAGPSTLA
jgi:hypothetical protein